jgi:uncharacterized protein (TIGR00251 family)
VNPRSGKDALLDLRASPIRIKLTAPPVEGEANRALVKFFARLVGVPQKDVQIVSGQRSRQKTVEIRGLNLGEVLKRLGVSGTSSARADGDSVRVDNVANGGRGGGRRER